MPLFEYRCSACGKKTEVLVLAGDPAAKPKCASCGSRKLSRLLSTFAAQASGRGESAGGFDAETACGGGECPTPGACGAGMEDF